MPIKFTNTPTIFQTYINQTLKGLVDDFYIVYLDDILIFSKIEEEYTKYLQKVCRQLKEYKLYVKPSKCSFYQKEIEFLGFIINIEGVQIDFKKVQTFVEWREYLSKTFRKIQVFLGFYNFYRRFIQRYIDIVRPFI